MTSRGASTKGTRKNRTLILRALHYVFLIGGILGLAYAGYFIAEAHAYQASEEWRFENVSKNEQPPFVLEGGVIGELGISRLGLKVIVVQGDSSKILQRAVGHLPETALPGEWGNVVLAGHRDSFFRPLRNIQSGDAITLKTSDGDLRYEVESTSVVSPNDVRALEPSSERMLTLITCFPFYYAGPAPNRFIVRARQVGRSE